MSNRTVYTVDLLYPSYWEVYPEVYGLYVKAHSAEQAAQKAKRRAYRFETSHGREVNDPQDFKVLSVTRGKNPSLYNEV